MTVTTRIPDSMIAALKMLAASDMPSLAILGDMGELGVQSVDCHKEIGKYAADAGIQTWSVPGNRMIDAAESFAREQSIPKIKKNCLKQY